MHNITAITVNFKTPEKVATARDSFAQHYPEIPHILIDNGGCAESLKVLREIKDRDRRVTLLENPGNAGHGPALNQGLALTGTRYAFLLDSDTETQTGGFLEKMLVSFKDLNVFAVGWHRWVNERGLAVPDKIVKQSQRPDPSWIPYIHPHACLLDVAAFRSLQPFTQSGAPALALMVSAKAAGLRVLDFDIHKYIWHQVGGTRGMFGGQCHPNTNAEPGEWSKLPI